MTVEKRVRLAIGDIAAITFRCSECGAALTLKAIREFRLTPDCPACHRLWPDGTDDPRFRLFRQIAKNQRKGRLAECNDRPVGRQVGNCSRR